MFGKNDTHRDITETRHVDLDGALRIDARLVQSTGEMNVSGGAAALMNGTFTFPEELRPIIDYHVTNGTGFLHLDHERPLRYTSRGDRMRWDIALHDQVPMSLAVNQATGSCQLDLATLNLTALKVERATGSTDIDLSGEHLGLRSVNIESSTGSLDMNLSGTYQALETLKIDAATGNVLVDLSGNWTSSLEGRISTATGAVTLRLPKDIGVEVSLKAAVSKVDAHGLHRDGNVWHNDAFGASPVTMRLRISSSVASVTMEVVD